MFQHQVEMQMITEFYSTANSGLTEPASFGYTSQQGTSISAAHVSAIAARIFSANQAFNPT
jgi:hypothetical protein